MEEYKNPWIFENEAFNGPIKPFEGFVYLIENLTDNRKYIGKKHFWSRQKDKKLKRRVTKESNWRDYYGSSDTLKEDVAKLGADNFRRTILHLCVYKKEMTFHEENEQWKRDVLRTDEYYNTNIGGRFFVRERSIYYGTHKEITSKNDKWRQMRSEMMKGESNIAKRPDVRKKLSDKKKGEKHHQYGIPITEEHKSALKKGHNEYFDKIRSGEIVNPIKGLTRSEASKKRYSEAAKKRQSDPELRKRQSEAKIGKYKGTKFYNDGVKTYRCFPKDANPEWKLGRLKTC